MKNKWSKLLSLFVALTFIVSTFAGVIPASAAKYSFAVDTVIEAEDTKLGGSAEEVKDKEASGKAYITTSGDRIDDPASLKNPNCEFEVTITEEGTYKVYAKVIILDGSYDSYYYQWDNGGWKDVHPGEKGADYVWLEIAGGETLSAGTHTFSWIAREPGASYDCFFVTADASKVPTIDRPGAESADGKPLERFKITDGSVMIEAEATSINDDLVSVDKYSDASGGKAVFLSKDDRINPKGTAAGGIGFEIEADVQGTYKIWARRISVSQGTDSCWLSLNGESYKDTNLAYNQAGEEKFEWVNLAITNLSKGQVGSVRIIPRETGAVIDKFIITKESGFIPTGEGTLPKPGEIIIAKLPEGVYPVPEIIPPSEHPRVMLRASDIPAIKANWNHPENAAAVKEFERLLNMQTDGIVTPASNGGTFNETVLGAIEAMAFDYVINGNEANGKQAILAMKNFIENVNYAGVFDPTRSIGQLIYVTSVVYDWCHPLLTDQEKAWFVSMCESHAAAMEIGWPPSGQGAVCGHGGEAQLLRDHLAFSIATYDEYPDIYNFVAGRFFSEYTETRNYWASAGTQHQGSAYSVFRRTNDLAALWLIYRMSGVSPYVPEFADADYQWIYIRRPDGEWLREGDDYNAGSFTAGTYWTPLKNSGSIFYSYNFYKDPFIKKEFLKENTGIASFNYTQQYLTPVTVLLMNDPSIAAEPVGELPKTKYFASPLGQMIARTGWNDGVNAPDAIAFMKIGEVWGSNHNHMDAGTFQIYYKGILASDSGYYDSYGTPHDYNYHKRTIAHNGLLIYDPDEIMSYYGERANDGGQRMPYEGLEPATYEQWIENKTDEYKTGEVLAHEFGPDQYSPEYSYISGDITDAYTDKVSEVRRSMIFMPNDNPDFPATFVVFDKITAKDKSFKKTFLLHAEEEITASGNVTVTKDTKDGHNGMMTTQTLLPKEANIEIIGGEGKEFVVDGVNYPTQNPVPYSVEAGWGRAEISPAKASETDYFLNVMYVNDADKTYELQKAELIETDGFYGAKILDKVVMFAKDKKEYADDFTFTVPGSDAELKVAIAGLKAGTWEVSAGGKTVTEVASEDGGIIYVTAPAGAYTVKYAGSNANKVFPESKAPELEGIDIKVGKSYIYTDVPATIKNDRTLVPVRAIFEALGAELSFDNATSTATAIHEGTEIKLTNNQKTAYIDGVATELDVPATIIDGRFLVPVRFVSEAMGAKVEWDSFARGVIITPGAGQKPQHIQAAEGYAQIVSSSTDEYSEEYFDTNSWDNNAATLYSSQGEHWVNYEFDKEYTLSGVEVWLNPNSNRVAVFDIWTSPDGENWTKIFDGKGDRMNPDNWEKFSFANSVTTKYVRVWLRGSDISMWNGLKEIRFKVAE